MINRHYAGRTEDLKKRLNTHLTRLTKIDDDYHSKLNNEDLIGLKTALSDVNNLLTLKTTIAAANWICDTFQFSDEIRNKCLIEIDSAKPNTNGFDIIINNPINLVGEVKCINPINELDRYGAAQWNSILDDAIKLWNGKKSCKNTINHYKFLFLLDLGVRTDSAIKKLLADTSINKNIDDSKQMKRHSIKSDMILCTNDLTIYDIKTNKIYVKPLSII